MKKIVSLIIFVLVFTTIPFQNFVVAATNNFPPTVAIYPPSSGVVKVGGSVTYRIVAKNATIFEVTSKDVGLAKGVTADVTVQNISSTEKTIVLSNVKGTVGTAGYIAIKAGVAKNDNGSSKTTPVSAAFTIIEAEQQQPQTPSQTPSNTPTTPSTTPSAPSTTPSDDENKEGEEKPEENKPEEIIDNESPVLSITKASPESVQENGEVVFTVEYKDNVGVESITLNESDITLYGFTAKVKITGDGNTRKITLSNIKGDLGGLKNIEIAKETAIDKAGNKVEDNVRSDYFKLVDETTTSKPDDWIQNPNTGK